MKRTPLRKRSAKQARKQRQWNNLTRAESHRNSCAPCHAYVERNSEAAVLLGLVARGNGLPVKGDK